MSSRPVLPLLRLGLLSAVALFSVIEFVVASVVVPFELRTYGGYNDSAAELAFTGGFSFLSLAVILFVARARPEAFVATLAFELPFLLVVWLFYIGGIGALTSETFRLTACENLFICRGFQTILAFGWLSWIFLTLLIGIGGGLGLRRWFHREEGVFKRNAAEIWEEGMFEQPGEGSSTRAEMGQTSPAVLAPPGAREEEPRFSMVT